MEHFDLNRLRLPERTTEIHVPAVPARPRGRGLFIKGPIPLNWMVRASNAQPRGRALHVGVALWFLSGIERTRVVKIRPSLLRSMGVERHAVNRALDALESAGLVHVSRKRGRSPIVTLVVDDK